MLIADTGINTVTVIFAVTLLPSFAFPMIVVFPGATPRILTYPFEDVALVTVATAVLLLLHVTRLEGAAVLFCSTLKETLLVSLRYSVMDLDAGFIAVTGAEGAVTEIVSPALLFFPESFAVA